MTVLPLGYLVARAGSRGWDHAADIVFRGRTLEQLTTTVTLMGGVAAATLLLGVGSAVAVDRIRLPWPRAWWILLTAPIAVPSYVAAFALLNVQPTARGVIPAVIVIALTTYPYVTLPTLAALRRTDHAAADVARSLGASSVRAFVTVTLPQILPAALAGALLCVLYALADFATPAMLRTQTLTVGVMSLFTGTIDRSSAAALSLMLIVLALFVVTAEQAFRRFGSARSPIAAREIGARRYGAPRTAIAAIAILTPALLAVVAPLIILFDRMIDSQRYASEWVGDLLPAAVTTVALGAVTAVVATALALPVAALGARMRRRWLLVVEGASFLGQALPGIVVALALVFLSLSLTPWAYQTAGVLVACYVVLFLPKIIGSARAAIGQVPVEVEEQARSLGRGGLRAWLTVTLPQAGPGIAVGAVLAMAATMKEVPATLLLRPTEMETLATELWSKTSIGAYGAATPAALSLILVGLLPAWLLSRAARR